MEEEETITQKPTQEAPITLALTHDQAVAIAAASIPFQAWFQFTPEMKSTLKTLDEVYHLILKQPHLPEVSQATLKDMRYHVAGLRDEPEGGSQYATARTTP